jgi:hypothetical protein
MTIGVQPRTPRFKIGDGVIVIGPGIHRYKQGLVLEIIEPSGDFVYRYRVRLADGTSATFFGFELDIKEF